MHAATNPTAHVNHALESLAQPSTPRPARADKIVRIAALTLLGVALGGCRPPHDQSDGVELVTSTDTPTPAMTFELRFEPAMVRDNEVGPVTTNPPLVVFPPLAGSFTWLSTRSGVFVPTEPLALGQRYELTLRPALQRADRQPAHVSLHRTVTTPPFGVTAMWPQSANPNASSEPEIKLLFNANVRAQEAQRFMYFRDESWHRIPADVRQGTVEEMGYAIPIRYPRQNPMAADSRCCAAVRWEKRNIGQLSARDISYRAQLQKRFGLGRQQFWSFHFGSRTSK